MDVQNNGGGICYCVTGGNGYIGSWLVKSLLEKGYLVHTTARDPEKISRLASLWSGKERLKIFRADLQDEGSFDEAVKGCHGVFHVAASMEFNVSSTKDSYIRSNVIEPATNRTLNLLKACSNSGSVERIVFTSSISTTTSKHNDGRWRATVDESCQTPIPHVLDNKASGWVYVLSKLISEETAFQYANERGIDLVSVIPTTVAGPFLTPTVPASVRVLLSPITGDPELYPILSAVHTRMGSISVVHIEDICNAHIFLMEEARAKGRYICSSQSCTMSQLEAYLALEYPPYTTKRYSEEQNSSIPSEISSNKLTDLGFEYKYGLVDIIKQSVGSCLQHGFLEHVALARQQHDSITTWIIYLQGSYHT
ncbi:putative anthocyanidin reductase isoform X4 [Papaver somniferum]|uniref:putative anthocyanidin reductase isoform X4 n=1 Tax=Papaver somniferum TaxID=3469 RepID=UPI000E6F6F5D|nr:putative anthocyanidin reductase isoform X4 [Papaver somniferum]